MSTCEEWNDVEYIWKFKYELFHIYSTSLSQVFDISSQLTQKPRNKWRCESSIETLCWLRPGIQTSFTVVIFFVLTWWIINEFEKYSEWLLY